MTPELQARLEPTHGEWTMERINWEDGAGYMIDGPSSSIAEVHNHSDTAADPEAAELRAEANARLFLKSKHMASIIRGIAATPEGACSHCSDVSWYGPGHGCQLVPECRDIVAYLGGAGDA